MLRYKQLLERALDPAAQQPLTLRDLAKALSMPVPSLHNYVQYETLPRLENIEKMAKYFSESTSSLFSEDDDLTAELVASIRRLPLQRKKALLRDLK